MKPKPFRRLRAFCSAFMLTLCVLILGVGFLVVEYNTRRTAFGPSNVRMDYEFEDGRLRILTPASEEPAELPEPVRAWAGRIWAALPARIRAAVWPTEAQQAAAPAVIRWLLDMQADWAEDYPALPEG